MMTVVIETLQIVGWHSLTHKRRNKQMSSTVKYERKDMMMWVASRLLYTRLSVQ